MNAMIILFFCNLAIFLQKSQCQTQFDGENDVPFILFATTPSSKCTNTSNSRFWASVLPDHSVDLFWTIPEYPPNRKEMYKLTYSKNEADEIEINLTQKQQRQSSINFLRDELCANYKFYLHVWSFKCNWKSARIIEAGPRTPNSKLSKPLDMTITDKYMDQDSQLHVVVNWTAHQLSNFQLNELEFNTETSSMECGDGSNGDERGTVAIPNVPQVQLMTSQSAELIYNGHLLPKCDGWALFRIDEIRSKCTQHKIRLHDSEQNGATIKIVVRCNDVTNAKCSNKVA